MVVRERRPWLRLAALLVVVGALAAATCLAYLLGFRSAGGNLTLFGAESRALSHAAQRLESANTGLRERVAILERAAQVKREAYAQVQHTLRSLQDQVLDLQEELAFYRGIVASGAVSRGLNIQSVRLVPVGDSGQYHYKLVLTRGMKNDKVIQGHVTLAITGQQGGNTISLALPELTGRPGTELKFRFQYFQRLEGQLTLPQGFVPHRVSVVATSPGPPQMHDEKTYNWPNLVG